MLGVELALAVTLALAIALALAPAGLTGAVESGTGPVMVGEVGGVTPMLAKGGGAP